MVTFQVYELEKIFLDIHQFQKIFDSISITFYVFMFEWQYLIKKRRKRKEMNTIKRIIVSSLVALGFFCI